MKQPVIRVTTAGGITLAVPVTQLRDEIGAGRFDAAVSAIVRDMLKVALGAEVADDARLEDAVKETLTPDEPPAGRRPKDRTDRQAQREAAENDEAVSDHEGAEAGEPTDDAR